MRLWVARDHRWCPSYGIVDHVKRSFSGIRELKGRGVVSSTRVAPTLELIIDSPLAMWASLFFLAYMCSFIGECTLGAVGQFYTVLKVLHGPLCRLGTANLKGYIAAAVGAIA